MTVRKRKSEDKGKNHLRVDFLNAGLVTCDGRQPEVFLTQGGKTRVFDLDIAIKTFRDLTRKLREYKKAKYSSYAVLNPGLLKRRAK